MNFSEINWQFIHRKKAQMVIELNSISEFVSYGFIYSIQKNITTMLNEHHKGNRCFVFIHNRTESGQDREPNLKRLLHEIERK